VSVMKWEETGLPDYAIVHRTLSGLDRQMAIRLHVYCKDPYTVFPIRYVNHLRERFGLESLCPLHEENPATWVPFSKELAIRIADYLRATFEERGIYRNLYADKPTEFGTW